MRKFFKSLFAILAIAGITAAAIYYTQGSNTPQRGGFRGARMAGPVPVVVADAKLANIPVWLDGVGTARGRNTVTVRPQVDGQILSVDFKEGQEVKAGDLLVQIDPVTYQAQLDQALAKKALDESQLANAKLDLERYTKLSSNVIAAKTVDTQRALVAQLEAQIKQDDAAIESARAYLNYASVVAPISGRTGMRMVDVGNLVRASDAGIVVITEVQPISVVFTLPQQDLPSINRASAKRALKVEALETDSKSVLDTGELQVVDNQVDQNTGTIRLKADFNNKDLQLWPGQFVNVRLLVDTLDQVVVVPTAAIQRGPEGAFVYVVDAENKARLRNVTITQQDENLSVIASGVAAADKVVTTGFSRLKDGADVRVDAPGDAAPPPATSGAGREGPSQASTRRGAPGDTASINGLAPAAAAAPAQRTNRGNGEGRRQRDGDASGKGAPGAGKRANVEGSASGNAP
ncbi:putative Co/Zn/Cd efflux system membrane fusion protein [Hyphomicrobium sulfonivorans]|uniref:Putative Co/Zn/Cd efflux system membrane fusion protein n=1 Tax=Hyphomicrobium sulfonivorans TaxID=121290 RepID=A0A109BAG8_HYPSL|nr:efflux RND transporter periplasmic adaptor subunit [Hyphomicrobium sulfonivorans]KWT65186.1 putative Co/Zn/Cd efflux system membrane fusion protein [Hyphomicrobium sulfonivorans]